MPPEIPKGQGLACRVIWLEVLLLGYMVAGHFASIMSPSRLGSSPSQGKSFERPPSLPIAISERHHHILKKNIYIYIYLQGRRPAFKNNIPYT